MTNFDLVVSTRPEHKHQDLARLAPELPWLSLPALCLQPLVFQWPKAWAEADFLFFVSQFAVDCFFDQLAASGLHWPASLKAAAVGTVTAQALVARGVAPSNVLVADQGLSDSESFLAWYEVHYPAPQRVLIVRATHGRDWLHNALVAGGVAIERLAVYERAPNNWSAAQLTPLLALIARKPRARIIWLLTSGEGIAAVAQQWAAYPALASACWEHEFLVIHPRLADNLKLNYLAWLQQQADGSPSVPRDLRIYHTSPDNEAIITALKSLQQHRANGSMQEPNDTSSH